MKKRLLSDFALLSLSVFWVLNYIVAKDLMTVMPPMTYTAVRFGIAFFAAALLFAKRVLKADAYTVKASLLTGLPLYLNLAIQTIGLHYTTPAKFGFISGFAVVLVPIISALWLKKRPGFACIIGVAAAVTGLGFLSLNDNLSFSVNIGDALTLLGTIFGAIYLIVVGEYSPKVSDTVAYGILQMIPIVVLSTISSFVFETPVLPTGVSVWVSLLYSGILATSLVFVMNNVLLKYTTATHAGLVYSSEPVLSAVFAYLLIGEVLTRRSLIGCALILAGMLINEFAPLLFPARKKPVCLDS